MGAQPARLKLLLQQRHLQTYGTFCREYDKAALAVDDDLKGTAPSRAQLYRWLSGELRGLPHPYHCRVLEKMFPGWTATQLFEHCPQDDGAEFAVTKISGLFDLIDTGLSEPGHAPSAWDPSNGRTQPPVAAQYAEADRELLPAALSSYAGAGMSSVTKELGQGLLTLGKVRRLPSSEVESLARLAGNVVELELKIEVDVAGDGRAVLSYRHELLNMSNKPLTRLARELWFEHATGPLVIAPTAEAGHRVAVQRLHEAGSMVKFACQVSPPIRPGEVGVVGYTCEGGRFIDDHYWRQSLQRYTRHLTIRLRHRGGGQLSVCTAIEEHPDGSENSATEELMWDYEGDDVVITLTRDYLCPNQAVTLRWAVANEPA